jgi:hypothetical protein
LRYRERDRERKRDRERERGRQREMDEREREGFHARSSFRNCPAFNKFISNIKLCLDINNICCVSLQVTSHHLPDVSCQSSQKLVVAETEMISQNE